MQFDPLLRTRAEYMAYHSTLLAEKRWDDLCLYAVWRKRMNYVSVEEKEKEDWLFDKLLRIRPFTEDVYQTIERLYAPLTPTRWGAMMGCCFWLPLPFETIQWLVERGVVIDWNTAHVAVPLLRQVATMSYPADEKEEENIQAYLSFLMKQGADPNVSHGGSPLLHAILDGIHVQQGGNGRLLQRIHCLLEHGADPLLPNKQGETAMDRVRQHTPEEYRMTPEEKAEIERILEQYA